MTAQPFVTIRPAHPAPAGRGPGVPAPSVEVASCRDCPVGKQAPFNLCGIVGALRTTPAEVNADMPPSDCPLRGGPVTLRLVDRGRP